MPDDVNEAASPPENSALLEGALLGIRNELIAPFSCFTPALESDDSGRSLRQND